GRETGRCPGGTRAGQPLPLPGVRRPAGCIRPQPQPGLGARHSYEVCGDDSVRPGVCSPRTGTGQAAERERGRFGDHSPTSEDAVRKTEPEWTRTGRTVAVG